MKPGLSGIFVLLLLAACETSGVKKDVPSQQKQTAGSDLDGDNKVIGKKRLNEGMAIEWFAKGKGETLKDGEIVMIEYKVKLKDGTVVDGNHMINKSSLPYLIGFNLQPGWDIAMHELKVGDFVRILIPPSMGRGEKGIEGMIPPNADNLLYVKILENKKPDRVVDGTKVWVLEENKDNKLKFNEKTQVSFHAMVSSPSNSMYVNTFRSNQPFTYKLSHKGLVPGLRKALINAKRSDRMYIVVPASEAYGNKGYLDLVKPNEDLFYNVLVMDVAKI
jgi:FKBP-type peptidyl-prolyl cis-trans isomerase